MNLENAAYQNLQRRTLSDSLSTKSVILSRKKRIKKLHPKYQNDDFLK